MKKQKGRKQADKSFAALQAEWRKRLEKSGFIDIEEPDDPHQRLKQWDSHYFSSKYSKPVFHARETYFQNASEFLMTYEFEDEKSRLIWDLHSQGHCLREIARISKAGNKDTVGKIVKALAAIMRQKI